MMKLCQNDPECLVKKLTFHNSIKVSTHKQDMERHLAALPRFPLANKKFTVETTAVMCSHNMNKPNFKIII